MRIGSRDGKNSYPGWKKLGSRINIPDRQQHLHLLATVPLIKEVEKDSETAARTKLENMMTEAMIRTCPKCGNRSVGFSASTIP
jgi:hypothetical protein